MKPPKPHARPVAGGWACFQRDGRAMIDITWGATLEDAYTRWWNRWLVRRAMEMRWA